MVLFLGLPLFGQDLPSFPWGIVAAPSEAEQKNVLGYGIDLATDYDDRTASTAASTAQGSHDLIYSVQPRLAWQISRRRWKSTLDYLAAFSYSTHRVSGYDLISQSLGFGFGYRFSKRLTLDLRNNFTRTSNPFDYLRANLALPASAGLDGPNSSTSETIGARRMEQLGTTLSYRADARSVIGIGGSFMLIDNQQLESASGFDPALRTISTSGKAHYSRQLGPRSLTGLGYTFQSLDFGHGETRTNAHTLVYFWNLKATPALMISVFAGPEYSATRALPNTATSAPQYDAGWSWAGGSTVSWDNTHTGLTMSAVRRITEGGWAGGNVRLDSFSARAKRQISRRSTIDGFITYNKNHLLIAVPGEPASFDYVAAGIGFSRKMTEHSSLGLYYWRVQQDDVTQPGTIVSGNRVGIKLSYENLRPLGRP